MNCPVCDNLRMREVEKEGILIDICPNCKGIWLDRGELEKLMEGEREYRKSYDHDDDYDDDYVDRRKPSHEQPHVQRYDDDYKKRPKYKKKRSVFDIFDDLF